MKKIMKIIVKILIFVILFWLLQLLFMPKYMTEIKEGALISEYYNEENPHDVIFVGDCEVYENFSPITLWEEYGITSYIRGSAQQLIWQSYYLLEETLKYEKPKVVVFNVYSMVYDTPQKEAYNRMTLDGMKLSNSKIKAIEESMLDEESFISYIFPLLRYHSRWKDLSSEDLKYMFSRDEVAHAGYLMQKGVEVAGTFPTPKKLASYEFGPKAYEYLDKMKKLCDENGIQLVLIKAPSLYPYWYEEWENQIDDYARKNGLPYINLLRLSEEIGLDFTTDTYDKGLHLNVNGAEKLSKYFGKILVESYKFENHNNDERIKLDWENKTQKYNKEKEQ